MFGKANIWMAFQPLNARDIELLASMNVDRFEATQRFVCAIADDTKSFRTRRTAQRSYLNDYLRVDS